MALEFLDKVCTPPVLNRYAYIPPKMVKGCQTYLSDHGDELQDALALGGTSSQLSQQLCDPICKPLGITVSDPDADQQRRAGSTEPQQPTKLKKKKKKKATATQPLPEL